MELVLAAGELGIDRDRNILARQRTPEPGGKRVARRSRRRRNSRAPPDRATNGSSIPVTRRVGMARNWAMPTRSFSSATPWSSPCDEVDPLAGRRPLPRLGVRDALAMDDGPQRQPIGARRLGRKSGERRAWRRRRALTSSQDSSFTDAGRSPRQSGLAAGRILMLAFMTIGRHPPSARPKDVRTRDRCASCLRRRKQGKSHARRSTSHRVSEQGSPP